jgi:hypothetical protein
MAASGEFLMAVDSRRRLVPKVALLALVGQHSDAEESIPSGAGVD